MEKKEAYSVLAVTRFIKQLLKYNPQLQNVWIVGELSNVTIQRSGHCYFTLKEEGASLKAVMFKNAMNTIKYTPKEGDRVLVRGSVDVYEPSGAYQIICTTMEAFGVGNLFEQYEKLKRTLEEEGLFQPERKKPIPTQPNRIGIATSATGAAIQDMITTIERRYPLAHVILSPTVVQGNEAPKSIINSLNALQEEGVDVIIVGRGGGSIEDLWCFNNEEVVRYIASMETPVISAVGHETDTTLADFAADVRAATPTAAAELVTSVTVDELKRMVERLGQEALRTTEHYIKKQSEVMEKLMMKIAYNEPTRRVQEQMQHLDEIREKMEQVIGKSMERLRHKQQLIHTKLEGLNPLLIMTRGYSIAKSEEGQVISSTKQIKKNDRITVLLQDGELQCTVEDAITTIKEEVK